ncbi:MAG: hypothetical protein ACHQF2_08490, partial [Flavobacteriales bacterium]
KKSHAVVLMRGEDVTNVHNNYINSKFHTYIWNNKKESFYIEQFYICAYSGNPLLYGVTAPILK